MQIVCIFFSVPKHRGKYSISILNSPRIYGLVDFLFFFLFVFGLIQIDILNKNLVRLIVCVCKYE